MKGRVEITHHRAERLFLKLSLGSLIAFFLLIAVIWGGHGIYVRWQEKRLVRRAEVALESGDGRTASLAIRAALQLKPESIPAARMAAQLAERAGDRAALPWRQKVAQAEHHSAEDLLAWARCALQFNDAGTAKLALSQVDESARQTAGFHAVAALLAQSERQSDKAEHEWTEAVRLGPEEKAYQLQLGAARMRSSNAAQRDSGANILLSLRADQKYRAFATRILITEGISHRQSRQKMLELARELQTYPESIFPDRILFLDLLRQVNDPQFASYLTEVEKSATERRGDLAELLAWMSQVGLNVVALDFIRTLKTEVVEQWPIQLNVADIYVRLQDWTKLERVTKTANWRDFDFLRHAYLARALRGQDKPVAADKEWALATKGATVGSERTLMLMRAASNWGWENEAVDILWALAKYPEKQKEALRTLYTYYAKNRDTQGLYRVLVRLTELNPENLDVQNNLAQVSLLLDAKPEEARRTAGEIYRKAPSNAAYATTYAYGLLTKGDLKGAAKVLSSLTEEQLKDPSISAYYGILLAAMKDQRARQFLDAGETATLLPEEKSLLEKARSELDAQ
jgi:hypothetical protein